jgi:hypothetical protein
MGRSGRSPEGRGRTRCGHVHVQHRGESISRRLPASTFGWSIDNTATANLVTSALDMAIYNRTSYQA